LFAQLTRDLFAIAKFLYYSFQCCVDSEVQRKQEFKFNSILLYSLLLNATVKELLKLIHICLSIIKIILTSFYNPQYIIKVMWTFTLYLYVILNV